KQRRPDLTQLPLEPVALHGSPRLSRHGQTDARAGNSLGTREPVQDEEPRGHGTALPVDGVEVPRAGKAMATLHVRACESAQAESRLRPFARRRFRIVRPARVDILARKPCLRFRLRTLGW